MVVFSLVQKEQLYMINQGRLLGGKVKTPSPTRMLFRLINICKTFEIYAAS